MVGAARSFHAETPRSDAKGPGALSCDASFYLLLFYKRKPCIFLVATLGPRALITQEQHVLVD